MAETKLQLFVKASEDGESVGHCPSCQRLFMVLLLKGVPFTLTTVDTRRSPDVLKDFAPGSQLPILLYDSDAKTDTLQIEDFLEETLGPPDFPSLAPRYRESNTAGNDVFHKFSAFIKNPVPAQDEGEAGSGGWMPKWEGVLGRVLTSPPAPSPVPAAAARPRQAGQLPARAPGARAGAGAAAARVPPPLPGRRPAHAGRLQPTAQAAHRGHGVRALPPGAHPCGAAWRPPLPGQRAAGEGVQIHVSAQRRDPGGLPARRAPPLAPHPASVAQ
ncbi:chloride intracellular channel protein 3 isoform X1 [Trachypithecus francoisi]|uniref:chloride intracellular channel protein 3 isoform X1 n=1 Tax=Trachypithecus francoisi TaxID=54180 RepID=UPI00141A7FBD|nr:chloride intracellular channel protein 3 isoform X1 [Trachypithecus francoisi]